LRGGSSEKIFLIGAAAVALAYIMKHTTGISITGQYSDKVKAIAQAIATAEGYGQPNAIPTVRNNPGDLTESDGAGHWVPRTFPTPEAGWNALYAYVQRMIDGTGHYNTSMTWREIGKIYDGELAYMNWVNNVTIALNVGPDNTLGDFVNA
jgi:hypothetical protein